MRTVCWTESACRFLEDIRGTTVPRETIPGTDLFKLDATPEEIKEIVLQANHWVSFCKRVGIPIMDPSDDYTRNMF